MIIRRLVVGGLRLSVGGSATADRCRFAVDLNADCKSYGLVFDIANFAWLGWRLADCLLEVGWQSEDCIILGLSHET